MICQCFRIGGMLTLKKIGSHPDVIKAGIAAGAVITCYAVWRSLENVRVRQAKWQLIEEFQESEKAFRADLRQRLMKDATRHKEIADLSFDQLVEQLQSGALKALKVLHAYQWSALMAAERTNCVATFARDAEERAKELDDQPSSLRKKPLHGVPVSLKETFILQGTEATAGFGSLLGKFKNAPTAPVVQFLIDQGAVPFCKTNVPQGILSFDSRNPIYGMTTHPLDPKRSPGGSTSGEGALLALHGSILGLGTDIGGSSRIPPSWCGVCSLKPTTQRMISDRGGAEPGSEGTNRVLPPDFGTYSFMARDSTTLSMVYRQFYSEETFSKNPELVPLPFRDEIFNSEKPLTIGYFYSLPHTVESVPAMKRAVRIAKEQLEKAGHKLIEFFPPNPRHAYLLLCEALVADGGLDTGRNLAEDVEISYPNQHLVASTWPRWYRYLYATWNRRALGSLPIDSMYAMVPGKVPHDLNIVWRKVKTYREQVLSAMKAANVDALLGPSFASPACHLNDPRDMFGAAAYTCIYNTLNWPAGIVPVTKVSQADQNAMASYPELDANHRVIKNSLSANSVGLPVAVQLASMPYCEEIVLRLMRDLESKLASSSPPITP